MNDLETQLAAGMRSRVADLTMSRDVLGAASRRHRRRVAARRTTYAAGVLGLTAIVAAALAITGNGAQPAGHPRNDANGPPATTSEMPGLTLAAAVAASESTSYRITVSIRYASGPAWTRDGAFDPSKVSGYLRHPFDDNTGRYHESRLVEGTWYVAGIWYAGSSDGSTFKQMPGTRDRLDFNDTLKGMAGASADPNELLRALRDRKASITRPSHDTYRFQVTLKDEPARHEKVSVVGEVKLNEDKRIATVVYETTSQAMKGTLPITSRSTTTIALSVYGLLVDVKRPTKVVVAT
jgi:hypothetical protein